jgi:hypothetical protein
MSMTLLIDEGMPGVAARIDDELCYPFSRILRACVRPKIEGKAE